jgi:DNA-binding transcriptional ArsR family regulator
MLNLAVTVQPIDKRDGAEGSLPDPRVALLAELAEPLRLRVVDRLSAGGPATVSELACDAGVSMPQLSNHLRRLREAGLVRAQRNGRHAVYEIADPGLEALIPMLDSITGRVATPTERAGGESRTC